MKFRPVSSAHYGVKRWTIAHFSSLLIGGAAIYYGAPLIFGKEYVHRWKENRLVAFRRVMLNRTYKSYRLLVDSIIGVNVAITAAWMSGNPVALRILDTYFLNYPFRQQTFGLTELGFGRPAMWSCLLSTFSHSSIMHLAFNMFTLSSFGGALVSGRARRPEANLSPFGFLSLYLGSGFFSSLFSNFYHRNLMIPTPSLGASGSIFALFAYYCTVYPREHVSVFFFANMTSMQALTGLTALNVGLMIRDYVPRLRGSGPMVDGAAHLAGTVIGYSVGYLVNKGSGYSRQRQSYYPRTSMF